MPSEKQHIRLAFGRAAARYDTLAQVQRHIADALLEHADARLKSDASCLALDAGSGTGYLGRRLVESHPALRVVSCDLAPAMAARCAAPALAGDLECLPLADATIDLYLSSLAWQWTALPRAVAEAARVVRGGGAMWVATLGPRTLHELSAAFHHADGKPHVRSFSTPEEIAGCLDPSLWQVERIESRLFQVHGASVRTLIESVRGLGAGVLPARRAGLFGRQAWRRMEDAYERRREAAGLPLSYEAIFIGATRR